MGRKIKVTSKYITQYLLNEEFIKFYQFRLNSIEYGKCTLEAIFDLKFERPDGIVCGPLFVALSDAAVWFSIMSVLGSEEMLVTTEMQTSFLKAASKENIICSAEILKIGKSHIFGVAECKNHQGELLTYNTLTYFRKKNNR